MCCALCAVRCVLCDADSPLSLFLSLSPLPLSLSLSLSLRFSLFTNHVPGTFREHSRTIFREGGDVPLGIVNKNAIEGEGAPMIDLEGE